MHPGVPLAAFGMIAGTIAGIAAAERRRDYYERPYYGRRMPMAVMATRRKSTRHRMVTRSLMATRRAATIIRAATLRHPQAVYPGYGPPVNGRGNEASQSPGAM